MGYGYLIYNNRTRNFVFICNKRSFDKLIISYKLSKRQNYDLVGETIKSALNVEKPRGKIILHSDGGSQYRSFEHKKTLDKNDIVLPMSAPGTPGDNACVENLFSFFKTKCIYMEKPKTPAVLKKCFLL